MFNNAFYIRIYAISLIIIAQLLLTSVAFSQKMWDGGALTKKWSDANNWLPDGVPIYGDKVNIDKDVTIEIGSDVFLNNLTITSNAHVKLTSKYVSSAGTVQNLTLFNTDLALDIQGILDIEGNTNSALKIVFKNGFTNNVSISGTLNVNSLSYKATYDATYSKTVVTGTLANNGGIVTNLLNNNLSFSPGGTYIHNINGGSIPLAVWDVKSNINITGVMGLMPIGLDQQIGNLTWNSPGQSNDLEFATNVSVGGNFYITNTGNKIIYIDNFNAANKTLSVSGNFYQTVNTKFAVESNIKTGTLNINGDLIIGGGNFIISDDKGAATVNLKGDLNMSGGTITMSTAGSNPGTLNISGDFTIKAGSITGTGLINFAGTGTQLYTSGGNIPGNISFVVKGGSTLQMADANTLIKCNGTFTLDDNSTLGITSPSGIVSSGDFGNIQVGTFRTFNPKANYLYNGNTAQVTGNGFTSAQNLTIDNLSGVSLSNDVNVSGKLLLTKGKLTTTSSSLLIINDNATVEGASYTFFISGPVKKLGDDPFTFPIGKNERYAPISMSAPSDGNVNNAFTAEYFPFSAPDINKIISPEINQVSNCEYWTLQRSPASSSTIDITVSWNSGNICSYSGFIENPKDMTIAHYDGTGWNAHGGSGTGSKTNGSVTWQNVSEFSPFTFARTSAVVPLPVHFYGFKAAEKWNGIQLDFSNLTESDIQSYEVERSMNGNIFTVVQKVTPKGNNYNRSNYSCFDATAGFGKYYYRIKAIETTGKVIYSSIIIINVTTKDPVLNVSAKDGQVFLQGSNFPKGKYKLDIISTAGQLIKTEYLNHSGGSFNQFVKLNTTAKGIYILMIYGNVNLHQEFIIL